MIFRPKDRLLDAAERIVLRDGVARLTLDAVAAETRLSKGGLLYHFPSKEALIAGMIDRLVETYETQVASLEAKDPDPKGRRLRAMLRASFPRRSIKGPDRSGRLAASLLAAVVEKPSLLEKVRTRAKAAHSMLKKDGIDPVTAMVVHMAADGLWMGALFGISIDARTRNQVLKRLEEMTRGV
jgi:AcrR family transcriptional regulator